MNWNRDEDLQTVAEVAFDCGVCNQTVRRWINRDGLRAVRLNSRVIRIRKSDLQAFLVNNCQQVSTTSE